MKRTQAEIRDMLPRMADFHKALSDANRLRIIRMIASESANEISVSEIAKRFGLSQPAVSQHLRVLRSIGLVVPNRKGNRTIYRINVTRLKEYRGLENDLYEVVFVACGCPDDTRAEK